ncbi:hypothetical protein EXIGLDRAFT_696719 [Exidia glandulosa HHB12029]|uniref:Uncharacterized protein n=1 Tax=Exidia glandulosa HHB12029 TaxID=1314781 RepID=A0A165N2G4_EXIGL|nr:hypothetical protein EXIGLDRAFT_696719 [Exidia glandulosa HHB12029]
MASSASSLDSKNPLPDVASTDSDILAALQYDGVLEIFVPRTLRRRGGFFFLPSSSTTGTNAPVPDRFLIGVKTYDIFQYDYPASSRHRAWIRQDQSWKAISEGDYAPFDPSLRLWLGHHARKASWLCESSFRTYSAARNKCPCVLLANRA